MRLTKTVQSAKPTSMPQRNSLTMSCRIPERVFHARGTAAKGYFELTHDISNLTSASLFNGVGKKTPVAVRFSTATNEKGSPESELPPLSKCL